MRNYLSESIQFITRSLKKINVFKTLLSDKKGIK